MKYMSMLFCFHRLSCLSSLNGKLISVNKPTYLAQTRESKMSEGKEQWRSFEGMVGREEGCEQHLF